MSTLLGEPTTHMWVCDPAVPLPVQCNTLVVDPNMDSLPNIPQPGWLVVFPFTDLPSPAAASSHRHGYYPKDPQKWGSQATYKRSIPAPLEASSVHCRRFASTPKSRKAFRPISARARFEFGFAWRHQWCSKNWRYYNRYNPYACSGSVERERQETFFGISHKDRCSRVCWVIHDELGGAPA